MGHYMPAGLLESDYFTGPIGHGPVENLEAISVKTSVCTKDLEGGRACLNRKRFWEPDFTRCRDDTPVTVVCSRIYKHGLFMSNSTKDVEQLGFEWPSSDNRGTPVRLEDVCLKE